MGRERQPAGQGQVISTAQVTDGEVEIRAVAIGWEGGRVARRGKTNWSRERRALGSLGFWPESENMVLPSSLTSHLDLL